MLTSLFSLSSLAAGPTNVSSFYARGSAPSIKTLISVSTNLPTPGSGASCTTNNLAVNLLTAHGSTANAGTYATASFTPTTNAFLFAAISGSPTGTETVTNTGSTQLTWWRATAGKTNYNTTGTPAGLAALYVTQLPQGTAPFSMTVVCNQASGTGRNIIVGEVTGADQSAAYGSNAVVQVVSFAANASANPTNLFAAPGNNGENTLLFIVADDINSGSDNAPTLSWTELWETNYNTPAHALAVYYSNNVPSSVTTATNTATSRDWATIVMEVKAGTSGCNSLQQSEENNVTQMAWAHVANDVEMSAASFRASNSITMTRIDVLLQKTGTPTSTINCSLMSATGTPGDPNTVIAAASNTRTGADISGATWLQFDFSNQSLTSGTDYYVRLHIADNASDTANYYQWAVDNNSGMANRMYRKETSASWSGADWASNINGGCVRIYGF